MASKCKLYFFSLLAAAALVSCSKDNGNSIPPPRDYGEQYAVDIDSIETYLKTHYLTETVTNGLIDAVIAKIPQDGTQPSIWDDSRLQVMTLKNPSRKTNFVDGRVADPTDYKLYYLILNQGGGASATVTDSVYTSYRGWTLDNEQFDRSDMPFWSTFPALTGTETVLIPGYRELIPKLRAAESWDDNDGDGVWTFHNAGAGLVFIPSGLGYFNSSTANIPAYSPLVFLVRLNQVKERDHDNDRVPSKYENLDANGNAVADLFTVDTDGDNIPDFLDIDDDNDGFSTKLEIRMNDTEPYQYYSFGEIPACPGGSLKKHRDKNCH